MAFDLETAKRRIGIDPTDMTQDGVIEATLSATQSIAESYCNRKFDYAEQTDVFYFQNSDKMNLSRYPVETIISINPDRFFHGQFGSGYKIHNLIGEILFYGTMVDSEITVTYTGGYKVLPADLELALWSIFDTVWPTASSTSGGGGVSAGDISSITIPDVGTVRFSSGSTGNAGASYGNSNYSVYGVQFFLLEPYRDHGC